MTNLLKEKIILPAWDLISNDTNLKRFYFFPGLLSIIFLTALLVYQFAYTYIELFKKQDEALVLLLKFFHSDYLIETIIVVVVFLILYIFLIPVYEASVITYLDKKSKCRSQDDEERACDNMLSFWLYRFAPMFEYNNLFSEFKFISVLNWYLFTIRFVWIEYIEYINYVFLFFLVFSIVINILFAYSENIIVLEDKKVIESISISSRISLLNLKITSKLYFLMFLFNIRVILNFLIFLLFPVFIIGAISFITSKIFLIITISILSILFVLLIIFLGYLTSVLEIFKAAIWYKAYVYGKAKLDSFEKEI